MLFISDENRLDCNALNFNIAEINHYVSENLGDRCVPPSLVLPTVFIYGLILILGVGGNLCTCVVIAKNKYMHSTTNFYLFSLAISDLLMLVLGLPMELYGVFVPLYPYQFSEGICKLRAFLIEFTSYASIVTITCFSIERWLAICFPLRAQVFSSLYRAARVIIGVWICTFLAALPVGWIVVLTRLELPIHMNTTNFSKISIDQATIEDTESCGMDPSKQPEQKWIIIYTFIFFFLLPALLISLVYFHIVIRLRSGNDYLVNQSNSHSNAVKSRKSVLKILVAVVIMFFICWFPFHLQRLMTIFLNESTLQSGEFASLVNWTYHVSFYVSGYCYYSNSACNPILYNILSKKYRIAFLRTICGDRITKNLIRRSTFKSKRYTNTSFNYQMPSTPQLTKSLIQIQPGGKEIVKKMSYSSKETENC